jgi:N-acetylated-alpha-linked acidic dipeptidase
LAEAKAIGGLLKSGWRPQRTLVYASWDGEEPGLIGSTEWTELHAAELKSKAALYINTDMSMRGTLSADGSQGLRRFISEVADGVIDPETGVSLTRRARGAERVSAFETNAPDLDASEPLTFGALGSGSDFTPFIQHLGIASVNLEFDGEGDYGVYHSAYDSFDHFRRFVDPGFKYGVALAKVAGHTVLRAAQAPLLPFHAQDFSKAVGVYVQELQRLGDTLRAQAQLQRALLDDGAFKAVQDPTTTRSVPAALSPVPHLDFAVLDNAIDRLGARAKAFDAQYDRLLNAADPQSAARRAQYNALLTSLELQLTDARGLPGRPWFTHMIYAPGFHTGYGVKTLPGVREAIEERRWDEANRYMVIIAGTLDAYGRKLEQAGTGP